MYYKIEQLKNILAAHKSCVFSLDHLCSSALEYIQHLEGGIDRCCELVKKVEAAAPKWISVEERLPEAFYSVLVYIPEEAPMPTVHEGYMADNGKWISTVYVREFEKVTHWMYMPEPPEEDK